MYRARKQIDELVRYQQTTAPEVLIDGGRIYSHRVIWLVGAVCTGQESK